jgi:PAS domain S-box-containing protein
VASSANCVQSGFVHDEMFRLLVDNVRDYAIFLLDPHGIVTTWNAGAEHIKGYAKEEIIGRHFSLFYTPDAIARHWPQQELSLAVEHGRFEDEGWRLRKDGTTFWANVVITPIHDAGGRLLGFAKITRDLTARRKVEALQHVERQMNEFLAMLAHELRNPLSPIQSALDVAQLKPDDQETVTWAHGIIARQTRQLSRLVDDLLDVSRITRGKISLRREPVDIREAVHGVIESLRGAISARRQTVSISMPDQPLHIDADPTRIAQALSNIIGNAIKYTHDGGRISIRASADDGLMSLVIADDGIGMPPELVARVFDVFVQGDRGLDRREGGLGVGLTIAKRLVDLQGGTLTATSDGPGTGSRFTLGFPLLQNPPMAAPDRPRSRSTSTPQRVLVVDDNRDAAEALAALIDTLGHQVQVLDNGSQALGMSVEWQPDIMLLDIGLPDIDGFEVARRLRTMPELKNMCLIACTGYGGDDDLRLMAEAGFDGHLIKPVGVADLERILLD